MLKPAIAAELRTILGAEGVIDKHDQLRTYESDGLTNYRVVPALVVLPTSTEQVQAVVCICHREHIPFVPRGSGTGLSGGALPAEGGIVISLARMKQILKVDFPNQRVVVQPGVINLWITQRVAPHGYYYAPDPSSQQVCSIGGNIAENSGGAHCLKYGFTVNHVLGMKFVMPDGELIEVGGPTFDTPGYDLPGIIVGSEGTLGIATEVTLRILRKPEGVQTAMASFETIEAAGEAVSGIIAAGIVPAAIEMMDKLAIEACEKAVHAGYPLDVGAVLLVELDGHRTEIATLLTRVEDICRGAGANVFHAGDGNLHPLVLYDQRIAGQEERAEELAGEIIRRCVAHGGSITGEHGVGMEKKTHMSVMFTEADLATHQLIRCAINPDNLCNPNKVYPTPRLCGEVPGPYRPHPAELAGLAERF